MRITIEHYGESYSAEMPEECSLWDFHMALRAICALRVAGGTNR